MQPCGLLTVCFSLQVALLNPIENPDLKLAVVMLIVPFFVNVSASLTVLPTPACALPPRVLLKALSVAQKSPLQPQAVLPICVASCYLPSHNQS